MLRHVFVWLWIVGGLVGCGAAGPGVGSGPAGGGEGGVESRGGRDATWHGKASDADGRGDAARSAAGSRPDQAGQGRVLAYVSGEAVSVSTLLPGLLEVAGGPSLSEAVLNVMLQRRLETAGIELDDSQLQREEDILRQTLADDENQAARLLAQLRESRGLGETRYAALLWRNAGLRVLVQDRVEVSEPAVQREFRLRYGPAARVRLLMVDTLGQAQRWRERATADPTAARFGELAAMHSTDPSGAAGGLLPWVRADDVSFPAVLREVAAELEPGQISPIITLDGGFGFLRMDEKRPAAAADYEAEKASLSEAVRLQAQRQLMQQLARELSRSADVVVLDPVLRRQWERQSEALGPLQ